MAVSISELANDLCVLDNAIEDYRFDLVALLNKLHKQRDIYGLFSQQCSTVRKQIRHCETQLATLIIFREDLEVSRHRSMLYA
jgi:CII-binding regulator of phage lambda lysogenization HflD